MSELHTFWYQLSRCRPEKTDIHLNYCFTTSLLDFTAVFASRGRNQPQLYFKPWASDGAEFMLLFTSVAVCVTLPGLRVRTHAIS